MLEKRAKHQEDKVTLILTFHPVLHVVLDKICSSSHSKNFFIKIGTTKTTTVSISQHKISSWSTSLIKTKIRGDKEWWHFPCCWKNCDICNILYPSNQFRSTVTGEEYKMNFNFNCNSDCAVYLLTCKVLQRNKQGQLLPRLDQGLISIHRISHFTEK